MADMLSCHFCNEDINADVWLEHLTECERVVEGGDCRCCGVLVDHLEHELCYGCYMSRCDSSPGNCDGRQFDYLDGWA